MTRSVRAFAVALTYAMIAGALHPADAADTPTVSAPVVDAQTACATQFSVTTVDGDPNAVVAHARNLAGPFTGTFNVYGADRMWTATIDHSTVVDTRDAGREASVTVRADAPIEGIEYRPAWASCTFHAGAAPATGYEPRVADRTILTVANAQPIARATCPQPYVQPSVTRAFEPTSPAQGSVGTVHVAVALDERGLPQFMRVIATGDAALNSSAMNAARRSEYQGAIFRCKPVPSGYEFNVQYI